MLQASKFIKPLSHCGKKKSSKKDSFPEPKLDMKVGMCHEVHAQMPVLKPPVSCQKNLLL